MRPLVLGLALLVACGDAPTPLPDAAADDASMRTVTLMQRMDNLEAETKSLRLQLRVAQKTILALQSDLTVVGGNLALNDEATFRLQESVLDIDTKLDDLTTEVDTLAGFNPVHQAEVATFEDALNALAVAHDDQAATVAALAEREGLLEDYAGMLAAPGAGPSGTTDELMQTLFTVDPSTAELVPNVDGAALGILTRVRKRPDLLLSEWDSLLDESIGYLASNPLYKVGVMQAAIDTNTANLAHFVDDWQGEVAYLKVEDHMIWTESHDQRSRLDGLDAQVVYLDSRIKEGDIAVGTNASKALDTFADALKNDYGKRITNNELAIGNAAKDVDGLWLEMARADAELQSQLDALTEETCATADFAEAMYSGDVDTALLAYERSIGSQVCGTTSHL